MTMIRFNARTTDVTTGDGEQNGRTRDGNRNRITTSSCIAPQGYVPTIH